MVASVLLIVSCNSAPKTPTPFKTQSKNVLIVIPGCEALHKEVEAWNLANPDKKPKKADC